MTSTNIIFIFNYHNSKENRQKYVNNSALILFKIEITIYNGTFKKYGTYHRE